MHDWQPIETAPRDGTEVLLTWMEADGQPQDIVGLAWDPEKENGFFPGVVGMWSAKSGNYTWCDAHGYGPTHWAPIPKLH